MTATDLSQITQAHFIKLGRGGAWEDLCLADGTLRLGYYEVPGDFDPGAGRKAIVDLYRQADKPSHVASNHARQVIDFYTAGPETLWITFAHGQMWWAQAQPAVEFLGNDREQHPHGSRLKRTLAGWQNCSIGGKRLLQEELSGKLTRSASYQQTICDIKGEAYDYLLRKLHDEELPEVIAAKSAKAKMLSAIENMIKLLTWQDFELFVDLVFARDGWVRTGQVGKTQKGLDMELLLPSLKFIAMVQVKSETTQRELEEYVEIFEARAADRMFFVYHTAKSPLQSENEDVSVLGPTELAQHAFQAGLVEWLIEKIG